jgi:hypothetical protein
LRLPRARPPASAAKKTSDSLAAPPIGRCENMAATNGSKRSAVITV